MKSFHKAVALAASSFALCAAGKPQFGAYGFDAAGMDRSAAPGADFYDYANGTWAKTHAIPADKSTWGTFGILADSANARLRGLMQQAAASGAQTGSVRQQVGDLYAGFMDERAIEARGLSPARADLQRIAAIGDKRELARALGATLRTDVDPLNDGSFESANLFGAWIGEDLDQPDRYVAYLFQGGLSLPNRDYYLGDSPRYAAIRKAFVDHAAKALSLAGYSEPQARAERILALETAIARAHLDVVASQDVTKSNTRWSRAELSVRAPGLDWGAFLTAAGLDGQARFGAWQPAALTGIASLVGSEPLSTWKDYLVLHKLDARAEVLPRAFSDERFAFYGHTLSGTPQQSERWKRAVNTVSGTLGDPTGRLYTAAYFPPQAKARAEALVRNIVAAFGARVDRLDWMSAQTKARAREKVATLQVSVGYPGRWRDYAGLRIVRDDPYGNLDRASLYAYGLNRAKLGRPVDRAEWHMDAQAVNAQNDPIPNLIIFPAAILEPPFFDPNADPAVNYGSIGAVIGHEISHSFDNTGALFDASGKLSNWWTPADFAHFEAASKALAAQYDQYRPLPDVKINGQQTLGENIADLAGIAAAYDAYHLSLGGRPAPVIDGMTGDQRFFLGFAQNYRTLQRETALRRQILTDVHSPGRYRAYTVRNVDAWYDAFGAQPGEALYLAPKDRVRVW